jgi:purine nucleosidase
MRTSGPKLPPSPQGCDGQNAVTALLQHLRQSEMPTVLVATGPLTNIAQALQQDPGAMAAISEIVWMGGSSDVGNHTPVAEFNAFADPEALAVVLASGLPLRMFGLNLCRQLLLTRAHVQALQALPGPVAACVAGHVDAYQRIRSADGSVPMPLYDPVVALWLMRPDLFDCRPVHVEVELVGRHTRGMTVCDLRRKPAGSPNVQLALQVQAEAAMALFMDKLVKALA